MTKFKDTRNILYSKGPVLSKHADETESIFCNFNDNATHYICIKIGNLDNLIGFYMLY